MCAREHSDMNLEHDLIFLSFPNILIPTIGDARSKKSRYWNEFMKIFSVCVPTYISILGQYDQMLQKQYFVNATVAYYFGP